MLSRGLRMRGSKFEKNILSDLNSFLVTLQVQCPNRVRVPCLDFAPLRESALLVVALQEFVVREAVQAKVRPAKRRRSILSPFQHATAEPVACPVAAYREVVHVNGIILNDLGPDNGIS